MKLARSQHPNELQEILLEAEFFSVLLHLISNNCKADLICANHTRVFSISILSGIKYECLEKLPYNTDRNNELTNQLKVLTDYFI